MQSAHNIGNDAEALRDLTFARAHIANLEIANRIASPWGGLRLRE